MGMVGLVISFAPAIGPTLSGWAVEAFSWRSLFYIILPFAVIDLILASILMKNVTTLRKTQIDILSVILSTFGFGGISVRLLKRRLLRLVQFNRLDFTAGGCHRAALVYHKTNEA